jgi:hypothetical protein
MKKYSFILIIFNEYAFAQKVPSVKTSFSKEALAQKSQI